MGKYSGMFPVLPYIIENSRRGLTYAHIKWGDSKAPFRGSQDAVGRGITKKKKNLVRDATK